MHGPAPDRPSRMLLRAEILSVGSELTAGETRDTNAGELARSLTLAGVTVVRLQALPDDETALRDAFTGALADADLVVSTGGLGPTPDDLTREAISAACGEEPVIDPQLETWLRALWRRRGIRFPTRNLKQAWLIPSAAALPNPNGTAPGWWVDRPDGRLIVAMPGPPREMRPMWHDHALPRLRERGLGRDLAVRTLRLANIGESQVADQLGDAVLRAANPVVATYARAEAVDIRIAATATDRQSADEIADETEARIREQFGDHVWAHGETTWAEAIGEALAAAGLTLATVERGTTGTLEALVGSVPSLLLAEARTGSPDDAEDVASEADRIRTSAGADVGVAIAAALTREDTSVQIAVAAPWGVREERRLAFLGGEQGRLRAALLTAAVVLEELRRGAGQSPPAVTPTAVGTPRLSDATRGRARRGRG